MLAFEGISLQWKLKLMLIGYLLRSDRRGHMLFLDPSKNDVGIFRMRIGMTYNPDGYLLALRGGG